MSRSIQRFFRDRFWREEEGQDLVEYALLIALVAIAAIAFIPGLTASIQAVFARISAALGAAAG